MFLTKVSLYAGLIVCAASACGEVPPTAQVTDEIVVTTPGLDHAMVRVAAGAFIMGSEDGLDDEGPIHQVHVDAFSIDKFEVTNEKFSAYVEATGVQPSTLSGSDAFDGLRHPVVGIVWEEASSYCKWAGSGSPARQNGRRRLGAKRDRPTPGETACLLVHCFSIWTAGQPPSAAFLRGRVRSVQKICPAMSGNTFETIMSKITTGSAQIGILWRL